jgi:hypothetical protein
MMDELEGAGVAETEVDAGAGAEEPFDEGTEEGYEDDSEYGEDDGDDPSPEDVAAWLEQHGYEVHRPDGFDSYDDDEPDWQPDPYEDLDARYIDAMQSTDDEAERAAITVAYNRELRSLDRQASAVRDEAVERDRARAAGMAELPRLEDQFEERGLPRQAAAEYVETLAGLPRVARDDPRVQGEALALSIGRAMMRSSVGAGGPRPDRVSVPRGESPAGSSYGDVSGVDAATMATLRANFPGVKFTPAKIAEYRKEGII